MIQGARGWCAEMTQRDGMGREVGGGFRMGNTRTLMADSSQCMAKPIHYCKLKKKKKRRLPAKQETRVQSPEREMAAHSSGFAWEVPRTGEPGGLQSTGSQRVRQNLVTLQLHGL